MPAARMSRRASSATPCNSNNAVACTTCDCYVHTANWGAAEKALTAKLAFCPVSAMLFRPTAGAAGNGALQVPAGFANCHGTAKTVWAEQPASVTGNAAKEWSAFCTRGLATAPTSYLVDLWIEQGAPCVDMNAHTLPAGTSVTNNLLSLVSEDHAGCGSLGADNRLSTLADTMTMAEFVTGNNNNNYLQERWGTAFQTHYAASNLPMNLYARNRIQLECSTTCAGFEDFQFNTSATALMNGMVSLWGTLKTMVWTTGILAMLCIIIVMVVAMRGGARASQNMVLGGYLFVLLCMFIIMVFAWYMCFATSNDHEASRARFSQLGGCIQDPAWAGVARGLYTNTSMDWFHNWMIWWVVATTLAFLVGAIALCYVLSALAKLGRPAPVARAPAPMPVVRTSHVVNTVPMVRQVGLRTSGHLVSSGLRSSQRIVVANPGQQIAYSQVPTVTRVGAVHNVI